MSKSFRETLKTISRKAEKARELIMGPRIIEFENGVILETSVKGEKPDIKLKKGGEVLEDFNAMVPEDVGIEFDPEGKWRIYIPTAKELNKEAKLYVGKFKDVDAILIFLHEIGHLNNREDVDLIHRLEQISARERRIDFRNAYPESRLKALAEERKWLVKAERDAWAFSLRKTRELERRFNVGIFNRIEGEGKTWERVKDFINYALQSHEQVYLDELYNVDIYTKEEMEQLFDRLLNEPAEGRAN